MTTWPFRSPEPEIRMVKAFPHPLRNAVATARTCYSSLGIVEEKRLGEGWKKTAQSIYRAGHHTTLQHAYFQFTLSGISRQLVWSFLHSHPFYNSEQISQRYVPVDKNALIIPPLEGTALEIYLRTTEAQFSAYERLAEILVPPVAAEYGQRFPGASKNRIRFDREVRKRAQEIARYVLPVAVHACLYHTVSALTLLRYYRCCLQPDAPAEQSYVVREMIRALLQLDPDFRLLLEEPLEEAWHLEAQSLMGRGPESREFLQEFDASLDGHLSRLVSHKPDNQELLAQAVREVLGISRNSLDDKEAIALAMNPQRNPLYGQTLNLSMHSKLTRTLIHPAYSFRRRISHAADSQDQRHRLTPASRPLLLAHFSTEPDYVEPALLAHHPEARKLFRETMHRTWEAMMDLRRLSVAGEHLLYLLPNAAAIRYTESSDLLNLRHKFSMRLCFNAQEEIWRTCLDELLQIREVNPLIGQYLLPPCALRAMAGSLPKCPEGSRFCGVPVWRQQPESYQRII